MRMNISRIMKYDVKKNHKYQFCMMTTQVIIYIYYITNIDIKYNII
jgi:hypothetical protein